MRKVLLAILWPWALVSGTVDFAVLLSSYRNPSSTTADNAVCDNACNNTFKFCLQDLSGNCGLGIINSSSISDDDFSFDSVLSTLNISNPLYFEDIVPREMLELVIEVYNNDIELVDTIVIPIPQNTVVSPKFSSNQTLRGQSMNSEIVLAYRITSNCPVNMFGDGCSVFCQGQNNTLGRYFCNYLGQRVCLENYYQPDNNCSVFCVSTDSSSGHYNCDAEGMRVCLSGYTDPASNCTQPIDEETDDDDDDSNVATSIGLIIVYIFVGYFFILFCIVAIFCACFVHCNCTCVKCCNSSYCMRPKCSPKVMRAQRCKIRCPQSVSTRADKLYSVSLEKCCPCCANIDACDSDELAFWTEIVVLVILCLPFAVCFIVIYAYATSK